MNDSGYHAGEIEVQERAGERAQAERLRGAMLDDELSPPVIAFLAQQRTLVVASQDGADVWATLLHGPAGFITAPGQHELHVATDAKVAAGPIGLLALEPATRRRLRVNGTGWMDGDGLTVATEQVYGNCPKYIQKRVIVAEEPASTATATATATATTLTAADRDLIRRADTFFLATVADGGADASHRGGTPGFVSIDDDELRFADYPGNSMYMSLGNLVANPRIGLLFVDFDGGDTLQLTGAAEVVFDPREVHVHVERAIRTPGGSPYRWQLLERSRFNP
jgi:predicted pyridoxine 5'-phosphate oxidase superfamily flavin-nucleotide-binding protein